MKLDAPWIDDDPSRAVFDALGAAGIEAFFVGGCVRNALMGEAVSDLDLASAAPPQEVIAAAEAAGLKAILTGIDHGTVTVVAEGRAHEITTFRRDVETDGRHAVVAFSTRMEEDAQRRDFTMNALYADRTGTVIDPLGGLTDLRARRVRFIGTPADRIREDYLRILRFFRFSARYADPDEGMEAEGLAACAALQEGLDGLARERVGAEMRGLLSTPAPAMSVAAMARSGILVRVLPGADDRALGPLVHLEGLHAAAPDPIRRLAVLGGEDPATALRLSKVEVRALATLRDAAGTTAGAKELGYRHGAQMARDILLIRAALLEQPMTPDAWSLAADGAGLTCPVAAADLAPRHSGKALGDALRAAEARWIASDFTATRDELLP